jgi:hypothetical protein
VCLQLSISIRYGLGGRFTAAISGFLENRRAFPGRAFSFSPSLRDLLAGARYFRARLMAAPKKHLLQVAVVRDFQAVSRMVERTRAGGGGREQGTFMPTGCVVRLRFSVVGPAGRRPT